jgi:chromosomal replication initiation ATPase DnaA
MTSNRIIDALRERDLDAIALDVAARRGVPLAELCGRGRTQSVARARHEVWWRIRHHPERYLSLPEIARLFGRDHTTIMAGIEAHAQRLAVAAITTSDAASAPSVPLAMGILACTADGCENASKTGGSI